MILVVRATGLPGGMITGRLLDQGKRVRALVRQPGGAQSPEARGVETVTGDLKDAAPLERACQEVEIVITAANSAARGGDDHPQTVEDQGSRNLPVPCGTRKVTAPSTWRPPPLAGPRRRRALAVSAWREPWRWN
jgi:uncharacterized protein YbjT (DUF2867 family)